MGIKSRLSRLGGAALLTISTMLLTTIPAPTADAQPTAGDCKANIVVTAPGSSQSQPNIPDTVPQGSNATPVRKTLEMRHPLTVEGRTVAYNSNWPTGMLSYEESRADGIRQGRALIARRAAACPNSVFHLYGYSEGADAMGHIVQDIAAGRGPIPAHRLASAALMANPSRSANAQHWGSAKTYTKPLMSPQLNYGSLSNRVLELCNFGDGFCDTETIAPHFGYATRDLTTQAAWARDGLPADLYPRLKEITTEYDLMKILAEAPAVPVAIAIHGGTYFWPGGGISSSVDFIDRRLA